MNWKPVEEKYSGCSVLGCTRFPAKILFPPNGPPHTFCLIHSLDDIEADSNMEAKWERKARQLLTGQEP